MTLLALVVAVTAGAQLNNPQGWSNYDFPFNPDANNDNTIGSADLLQVLAVFGNEYGNNPPACDYIGTDFENLWANFVTGIAIMDSLFYEVEMSDIQLSSYPGCPDMVWDTVTVILNGMIYDWQHTLSSQDWRIDGYPNYPYGYGSMRFQWYSDNYSQPNTYKFTWNAPQILNSYLALGWFDDASSTSFSDIVSLPFPDGWTLDGNGIHFPPSNWGQYGNSSYVDWLSYATSITIIPYWHYAE